jgi:hypothetical protein
MVPRHFSFGSTLILDPDLQFVGPVTLDWLKINFFVSGFYFHKFLLIRYIIAQASGFSAPGAVGGLPEERGGAAEEVATGSGTNSGSSAPAPAQFHLGEVKFSGSISFVNAGPHLSS